MSESEIHLRIRWTLIGTQPQNPVTDPNGSVMDRSFGASTGGIGGGGEGATNSNDNPGATKEIYSLSTDIRKDGKVHRDSNNGQIIALLNGFAMTNRVSNAQTRRHHRQSKQLDQDLNKIEDAMVQLIHKMDFQFMRRFSDAQSRKMVRNLRIKMVKPDEFVYHKGDIVHDIYFIFIGEVDVLGPEPGDPVKRLGPCLNFGDSEKFGNVRKSSAVAHSYCILGILLR